VIMDLDSIHTAQVLGKSPGAVRIAAHRGLRTLAGRLAAAEPVRGGVTLPDPPAL
jgi:RNA polymerase sigma-70 factor, ECF subfamily